MHNAGLSIWFFIGVLLTVYGVMILGYGLFEVATRQMAHVFRPELHAPIWWGAMLALLGVFYLVKFRPGRIAK